jgi:hypothetical protein
LKLRLPLARYIYERHGVPAGLRPQHLAVNVETSFAAGRIRPQRTDGQMRALREPLC